MFKKSSYHFGNFLIGKLFGPCVKFGNFMGGNFFGGNLLGGNWLSYVVILRNFMGGNFLGGTFWIGFLIMRYIYHSKY